MTHSRVRKRGSVLGSAARSTGALHGRSVRPSFFDMSMYVFMFMLWFSQMHAMLARSRGVFKKLARCWHARTLGSVSVARKVIATVSIRGAVRRLSATWTCIYLTYFNVFLSNATVSLRFGAVLLTSGFGFRRKISSASGWRLSKCWSRKWKRRSQRRETRFFPGTSERGAPCTPSTERGVQAFLAYFWGCTYEWQMWINMCFMSNPKFNTNTFWDHFENILRRRSQKYMNQCLESVFNQW